MLWSTTTSFLITDSTFILVFYAFHVAFFIFAIVLLTRKFWQK